VDLDHVALATRDVSEALRFLVGELGATVLGGGQLPGFRPMQVRLGDGERGMTVELLEPWESAANDFLARFLGRHGDGPHHLTVKVEAFDDALVAVRATGRDPVGVNRSDKSWLEAFILPRDAFGTVVQIAAQSPDYAFARRFAYARTHGPEGAPVWWPSVGPRAPEAVRLRQVVLRTGDLPAAHAFFGDLLGGGVGARGSDFVELGWPGGAQLRLEGGDGPDGIVRLELDGPARDRLIAGTRFVSS
jgi:catechol 2,3-dioxygenase-like lactoylglutathione lyase family enzyme